MITKLARAPSARRASGLLAQLWQWRAVALVLGLVVWSGLLLQHQLRFAANYNVDQAGADLGSSLAVDDDGFGSPQPQPITPDNDERSAKAASTLAPPLSGAVERVDEESVEGKVVRLVEAKGVYKPFRTAVDLLEEDPNDVPPLVRAWRRGLLDFHDIRQRPPPPSVTERSKSSDIQYTKLDKLLHLHNGKQQFGPLFNYEFCRTSACCTMKRDAGFGCLAPGLKTALGDDYCDGKLESNTLEGYNAANPHNPLRVVSRYSDGQLHGVGEGGGESEQCEHYIHGMPHMTHPADNSVAMYFHWYADYLLGWWADFEGREHEDHVVIVDRDAMTTRNGLFSQYGLFSRHECYRYRSELKENTCFTMVKQPVTTARDWTDFASWALQRLEIKVERPTESHVGIISRSFKRFLLNEQELLHATLQLNVSAELLLFDTLPFYQQVQALRRTTVLVGMHGSGLTNALYLQRGAVLLQIMPFKTGGGAAAYQGFTHGAGAVYKEWTNPCQECTVMHWDILNEQEKADKAGILERGGWSASGSLYFWFWVNQETYVDPKQFQALIRDALSADYLHAPQEGGD
ncbi:uncharacterized protein ACA1_208470 [Acanthamoeba castellanii str. Neff]|uniref:Glycosyltransferase 61 catalytic domain-containing protein n=1 Tax=Acanthamoeba castellanii (strain ATCC 30010 / Neff) TaxID=1257118 RepID=L8GXH4_ACACF|nr:uncharacterized protein ACA1_208470 [Acanthamoeba castellanii str. Neff]ELR17969.1 hypothetical protein ACA1_208470 [Acanthamoeba castellanii str. Neff]